LTNFAVEALSHTEIVEAAGEEEVHRRDLS